ncbi:uncharacterized protein PV09_09385 [Verruconis gallopava]|uniref:Major facilitator superfamily (MFS) profile domain-containing protein n=1 Tax=Verruconis gallopava TaxID=253628 RepID=A0A0D1ZXQ5_9PEZI|nr:uncharacterized protein PV09_09385 [Verruconis gallopava]KIV98859.1 hypothetical protein PV09_09385 [Verruconis gallopava]
MDVSVLLGNIAVSSFLLSAIAGVIADRIGSRQQPYLAGIFSLLPSIILLAFGQSIAMIAFSRILQGMSIDVVWVFGLTISPEIVAADKLGTVLGTIFSFALLGAQGAPMLGGILYAKTGYATVFAVCRTLIASDIILRFLMIEKRELASLEKELPSPSAEANSAIYELSRLSHWLTCQMPIIYTFYSLPVLLTAFYIGFAQAFLLGYFDTTIPLLALE